MGGAERLENGTLYLEVLDKDLDRDYFSEKFLREEYEKLKNADQQWEISEEEEHAIRIALINDLHKNQPDLLDHFEEVLEQEFAVFKKGEKYSFVKDLRSAYQKQLATPLADRIFDTIPEHVFWDIKTPLKAQLDIPVNPYNPFREYPFQNFFEYTANIEYNDRRILKKNLADGVSTYTRY